MYRMKLVCAALLGVAMTASTVPAMAAEPPAPSVAESIQAVAGVDEDLLADPVSESRSPVDVPEDSRGMVDFDGTDFAIGLPGDQDADATRRGDTVVFAGTDTASSTVVTPTAEGVQIMTVLDSAVADSSPTYELDLPVGGAANTLPDGSILLTDANGAPSVVIAAPWAQDATGRELPTRYALAGDQLTQHIDTTDAAYPVVADPAINYVSGLFTHSLYLSRAWTRKIAKKMQRYGNASSGAIAAAFGIACLPIGGVGAVVCASAGAVGGGFAIDQFLEAKKRRACVRFRVSNPMRIVVGLYVDNSKYCPTK